MVLLLKIVKWKSAEMMGKNQLTVKTDDEDLDSVIEGYRNVYGSIRFI